MCAPLLDDTTTAIQSYFPAAAAEGEVRIEVGLCPEEYQSTMVPHTSWPGHWLPGLCPIL